MPRPHFFLTLLLGWCLWGAPSAPAAPHRAKLPTPRVPAGAPNGAPAYGAPTAAPTPFVPTAPAYVVMDLDSGRVLDVKNPDQRMFPASTTKLMTCLVAYEHGNLSQIIRASKNTEATGESGIDLIEGENHTLDDLIHAALIKSANDACVDIAEGVGGTQAKFVTWMNQKAHELGCKNTHFVNPHGLHNPNHYTTARDLARIGRAVALVPFLSATSREKTATIGGNWRIGPTRVLINRNKLLWRWPQCDGLKTGYTHQAGNCLVATATQPDPSGGKPWRLLCVVMKSWSGHSWPDAEFLLKRAFANYVPQAVAQPGEILWQGAVRGGAYPLEAVTSKGLELPLRSEERASISHQVEHLNLTAPIKRGQPVGAVVYFAGGKPIARLALLARDDVPQTMLSRTIPAVGNHFPGGMAQRLAVLGVLCAFAAVVLLGMRARRPKRKVVKAVRRVVKTSPTPGEQFVREQLANEHFARSEPRPRPQAPRRMEAPPLERPRRTR